MIVSLILLACAFLWAFGSTATGLAHEWRANEDYSAGQLVPLVVVFLLWRDREYFNFCFLRPSVLGLTVLGAAVSLWLAGLILFSESLERYAMVVAIWGLTLAVAGWSVVWHLRWLLLFLLLMVPLPGSIHNAISGPLQDTATRGAVFLLELIGVTVAREGNVMLLNYEVPVAVAEACSGLRMLTAFLVVAAAFAFIVPRPPWQKATLFLSSLPIAIGCNVLRLVLTALLFLKTDSEAGRALVHDAAGWAMMPVAIFALFLELWLFQRLVVPTGCSPCAGGSTPSRSPGGKFGTDSRGRAEAGPLGSL